MKKIELLCPAGNYEMLTSAIHNGADAVYISGKKYGARKFAQNFSNDEIKEAINFAHLYGVKVYVTANTLIRDEEVEDFINYIEFLHKNNVDAVIMQDLGMINLTRKTFPNLEIHASTQFHNHNSEDLKFLKSIGVTRAVLARELSIKEIGELDVDIEKEVFVHGALCICYSGQCLMSSIIMNRSGNRGECAGMCRLPYGLIENGKKIKTKGNYILSPKELCTIENIHELIKLNVDSIKIEGRMKSPEYVGYVTKLYRKAIDNYYDNKQFILTDEEKENLLVLFNRQFTKGFLFNDNNLINQITPNHQGIEIGEVLETTNKKIKIELHNKLNQGDAIRFKNNDIGLYVNFIYNKDGKFINSANKNDIVYIDNKIDLKEKDIVLKTIDIKLIDEIKKIPQKKIPIYVKIKAKINTNLEIEFNDGKNCVKEYGSTIEQAKTYPTTKEDILEKINKLGNSIYYIKDINLEIDDNIFLSMKNINDLRRKLIDNLNAARQKTNKEFIKKNIDFKKLNIELTENTNILTDNEESIKKYSNQHSIYTNNYTLYKKYSETKNILYRIPRIINRFENYNNEKLLTSDIGTIYKYKNNNLIYSDIYMNVTNIYTVELLLNMGVKCVSISPELKIEEAYNLYNNFIKLFKYIPNINIFVYGRIELMILKHCIIKSNLNCGCCKSNNYELIDRNNKLYPLVFNGCNNIILNCDTINYLDKIERKKGINIYLSLIKSDKDIIMNSFMRK